MKKIFSSILLIFFIFNNLVVFSLESLKENYLYYLDTDNNGKIDKFEIEFNKNLTGILNLEKFFIYSNTGGLSTIKLDSVKANTIVSNYYLSGNILALNLIEQDNYLTGLIINNSTTSHLRLKTNAGVGIVDTDGQEMKFLLTTSLNNYINTAYKETITQNTNTGTTNTGTTNTGTTNTGTTNTGTTNTGTTNTGTTNTGTTNTGTTNTGTTNTGTTNTGTTNTGTTNTGTTNTGTTNTGTTNTGTTNTGTTNTGTTNTGTTNTGTTNTGSTNTGTTNTGSTNTGSTNSGTTNTGSTNTGSTNIFSHKIKLLFQSPSYLIEKDTENLEKYNCDNSKTDCKVNYNLNIDEGDGYKTIGTKYICEWDFGFEGDTLEEKNKCNPNTITYPIGEFKTKYRVAEKSNTGNFIEKTITIKNEGFKEESIPVKTVYIGGGIYNTIINYSNSGSTSTGTSNTSNINIDIPEINIQGGIDENNICIKDDCNLNLIYIPQNSKEACLWSFPLGSYDEGTQKKCNPGYIKYPLGDFKATLKVYEQGNESNFKESYLYFSNKSKNINKIEQKKEIKSSGNAPKAVIKLQGSLQENKKVSGNYLTCNGDCNVNFDGSDSYHLDKTKFTYLWDLGNGETFSGSNPPSKNYSTGEYKIILKITDEFGLEDEDYFIVKVIGKDEIIEEENIISIEETEKIKNDFPLKITKVLPNPIGADNLEFIEIQNTGTGDIDLISCSLDDEKGVGSKEYFFKDSLTLKPEESKKFYKYDTEINLNNSAKEEVNLFCNNVLIDNLSWNFGVSEGFILSNDLNIGNIKQIKKQKNKNNYEVSYLSGEEKIISFENEFNVLEDVLKEDLTREEKKEKIFSIIEKSFYQKISKQKSGIKVYGTTLPNVNLIIKLEKLEDEFSFLDIFINKAIATNDFFETKSDKNGSYELFIKSPNIGEFEVKTSLNLGKDNIVELSKKTSLEVDEEYITYINSSKTKETLKKEENEYIKPKSIISLQGKIGSNKTFFNNKLVCYDVNECSINLDGSQSEGQDLKYFWDFGNGNTSTKKNPGSYKLGVGKHIISLSINDENLSDISYFAVEIIPKPPKEKKQKDKIENISKIKKENLKISEIELIPSVYAEDINSKKDLKTHIFLSIFVFFVFISGSLILLKREKII